MIEFKAEKQAGVLSACVSGRIDSSNASEFEHAVKAAIEEDDCAVVMDCEELSYISSAGLRVILLTAKSLWSKDAKFVLCSLPDQIREIFAISGFDKIIAIYPSRIEALASIDG